ncbi:MAG: exonuclease SbcCD subunit D [Clostridia bacterium]|nr:exonuclease SbcCD subunit D [Clostridia bacterium]
MKFLHISDLHLGRLLHRYSLQEEQTEMLERIRMIVRDENPDAVLIAGDVYDRSIPPVYATQLLDQFLASLTKLTSVFMISGNHDSAERLSFLSGPLQASRLYIAPVCRGSISPITLTDSDGPVDIWLLPFVKPATIRAYFPEETIDSTNDAVSCILRSLPIDPARRNVLVAHQFVAGGKASGSEEAVSYAPQDVSVGGSDMVDARIFAPFDYVALGHIHRAQNVGSERIRYCGTPMAYDFSECGMEKSITMVDLDGERHISLRTILIPAPRELVELRGTFDELTSAAAIRQADKDAYTHVILTDEVPVPDVINRLRQVYPRLTHLDWDNQRTRSQDDFTGVSNVEKHTPLSLFGEFFQRMNGAGMSQEQEDYVNGLIHSIWEAKQ